MFLIRIMMNTCMFFFVVSILSVVAYQFKLSNISVTSES